ncbi:uncharacterized protein LOC143040828 [Oratosquilla oratoria]|uniref:uncharacterized protein LOC143040828 n=1 Tax=Oratosquilla oratoria TaxID=337810 RepID=UPI003F7718D0
MESQDQTSGRNYFACQEDTRKDNDNRIGHNKLSSLNAKLSTLDDEPTWGFNSPPEHEDPDDLKYLHSLVGTHPRCRFQKRHHRNLLQQPSRHQTQIHHTHHLTRRDSVPSKHQFLLHRYHFRQSRSYSHAKHFQPQFHHRLLPLLLFACLSSLGEQHHL